MVTMLNYEGLNYTGAGLKDVRKSNRPGSFYMRCLNKITPNL
jgi:hypothetical protein